MSTVPNRKNQASQTNADMNTRVVETLCASFSEDPRMLMQLRQIASKHDVLGGRGMKKYQLCQRLLQDRAGKVSSARWVGAGLGALGGGALGWKLQGLSFGDLLHAAAHHKSPAGRKAAKKLLYTALAAGGGAGVGVGAGHVVGKLANPKAAYIYQAGDDELYARAREYRRVPKNANGPSPLLSGGLSAARSLVS